MKGYKLTGNGPKYGRHSFSSKAGFSGSTGKVQKVRGYNRAVPQRDKVGSAAPRRAAVSRGARPGYADGGKVESVGQAIKMVRELIKRGNSAGDAAKKAASRYQVPMDQVSKAVSEPGTGGDPRLLARGGAVANTPATARRASFVPGKGFRRGPLVG